MTPLPENTGIILMEPQPEYTGVIYMQPDIPAVPPPGGGGGTTYGWVLHGSASWDGSWSSASWNSTPGDWSGAFSVNHASGGWKYIKIVYASNYWQNSAAIHVYQLQLKTAAGFGVFNQPLVLDTTTHYAVGYYDINPAGCSHSIYYLVYVSK
jgi:hypothetical protein